jgi:hypothetical protein
MASMTNGARRAAVVLMVPSLIRKVTRACRRPRCSWDHIRRCRREVRWPRLLAPTRCSLQPRDMDGSSLPTITVLEDVYSSASPVVARTRDGSGRPAWRPAALPADLFARATRQVSWSTIDTCVSAAAQDRHAAASSAHLRGVERPRKLWNHGVSACAHLGRNASQPVHDDRLLDLLQLDSRELLSVEIDMRRGAAAGRKSPGRGGSSPIGPAPRRGPLRDAASSAVHTPSSFATIAIASCRRSFRLSITPTASASSRVGMV